MDFDEFLQVVPPNSLDSLLEKYNTKSWLSFGGIWWDVNFCEASEKEEKKLPFLEKMVFKIDGFFCSRVKKPKFACVKSERDWPGEICKGLFGELCDVHNGRRKYFVNPRKVRVSS